VCGAAGLISWMPTALPAAEPAKDNTDLTSGDPVVDNILERLEAAGRTIQDLRSQVAYKIVNPLIEDEITKKGELFFKSDEPNSRFLVRFDKTIQEETLDRKKEWHLFDGRFYTEARESTKQVIKREVVAEGDQIDPFEIGKGPFPLPFGQKKGEILKHFTVKRIAPAIGDPANTDHLECLPREGSPLADQYKRVEFYVDKGIELPVKIFAITADDSPRERTAEFTKLEKNPGFGASVFRLKEIQSWPVTEELLK
jgi:hypothetical protein